jgi:hypothetical protein
MYTQNNLELYAVFESKFKFSPIGVAPETGIITFLEIKRLVDVCLGKLNATTPVKKRIKTAMKAEHKASRWT